MDIEGRRIANREARAYRESLAYIRGFEEGLDETAPIAGRYLEKRRWIWAIEKVRSKLELYAPNKAQFFCRYFGLDRPLNRRESERARLLRLSSELYVGESTLYKWREQILDELVLAATQAGVYHPF
ncbi:MAG: hypothetical protein Q4C04_04140 [Clostridia bacterium]|nr:hypothetical protein [Clostridia bacterium]